MSSTAIIIGTAVACDLLEGQLGFCVRLGLHLPWARFTPWPAGVLQ